MENEFVKGATDFIREVGFPIFVAVWLLVKNSRDSEKFAGAMNGLKDAITVLTAKVTKE